MAEKVASDFQAETLCGQLVTVTSQVVTSVAEIEEDLFLHILFVCYNYNNFVSFDEVRSSSSPVIQSC